MEIPRQDDLDGDEEYSVMGSHHTSDENDSSDDGSDVHEYARYHTDLEKWTYDQLRWNGIGHGRKYTIDPRHRAERQEKANLLGYERISFAEQSQHLPGILFLLSHIPSQSRSQ